MSKQKASISLPPKMRQILDTAGYEGEIVLRRKDGSTITPRELEALTAAMEAVVLTEAEIEAEEKAEKRKPRRG